MHTWRYGFDVLHGDTSSTLVLDYAFQSKIPISFIVCNQAGPEFSGSKVYVCLPSILYECMGKRGKTGWSLLFTTCIFLLILLYFGTSGCPQQGRVAG